MAPLGPGSRVGPYELVAAIGRGGMGDVWKARDTRVDRNVAIKFCQPDFAERFEREARAIAALNHPNICQLYDVGPDYLVMEYVDGAPLGPCGDWRKLLDIAIQIAGGLAEAHAAGIVHRDLKPDNILVTREGRVKILDFGLAKQAVPDAFAAETRTGHLTMAGAVLGTIAYMSPEQARGESLDARSDQFAFGLILYELAAGTRAFDRPSSAETMAAIIRDEPPSLPEHVPAPLGWIIERCLAKEPAERYESTRDLYQELKTLRDRWSQVLKRPVVRERSRRRVSLVGLAAAAALIAVGLAVGVFWARGRAPVTREWIGTRLGGPRVALSPRLSPDGQLLAFIAVADGTTRVGVMKPGSNSWTLLTTGTGDGYVENVSWSHDGSRLYFDRFWGQPMGIYTIPPLGGDPVLLLDRAVQPIALSDGSLLVLKVAGWGLQVNRFWPDDGRLQPLPAYLDMEDVSAPVCAFPDGRRMAFFGRSTSSKSGEARALHVLDLDSGNARTLKVSVNVDDRSLLSLPVAVTPDGRAVITLARRSDTYDLIEVPIEGSSPHRVLFSLRSTELPWYIEAAPDGSLYLDEIGRPYSFLRFNVDGTGAEQFPAPTVDAQMILPLPDGRLVFSTIAGKSRVLVGAPDAELRPLLQTDEEARGPFALAGADAFALMVGPAGHRRIAIASTANGRLLREIPSTSEDPTGLAISPDQQTFYYAYGGRVYALTGSGTPRPVAEGDAIALDPSGRYLYVKQFARNPIRLVKVDVASGAETPVPLASDVRLTTVAFSPRAVDARERVLVDVSPASTWFYRPALLEPGSGKISPIPVPLAGDCMAPGWTADGRVICAAAGLTASLWHYVPK